jgi:hypothetical protein
MAHYPSHTIKSQRCDFSSDANRPLHSKPPLWPLTGGHQCRASIRIGATSAAPKKHTMSASVRKNIAAFRKARWANLKAGRKKAA